MATESGIRRKYTTCLDHAVLWLNRNSYAVYPKSQRITSSKDQNGDVIITTSQPIHLKEWPERQGSRQKIDILVSLQETVSLKDEICLQANASVTYFRVADGVATAVESLHYDSAVPPAAQPQHPVCHAQNNRRYVNPLPESFVNQVNATPLEQRCQTVRIPTAFVNLPGVLAILAADHMLSHDWRDFMDHCITQFRSVPALPANVLEYVAIPTERLSAWNWYIR